MVDHIIFPLNPGEGEERFRLKIFMSESVNGQRVKEILLESRSSHPITEIDLTNVNFMTKCSEALTVTCEGLLPYILQEKLCKITVQDHMVSAVRGSCHVILMREIRGVFGDELNILNCKLKMRDVLSTEKIVEKIVGPSDSATQKEIKSAAKVLQKLHLYTELPIYFCIAVKKAAVYVRRTEKSNRRSRHNNKFDTPIVDRGHSIAEKSRSKTEDENLLSEDLKIATESTTKDKPYMFSDTDPVVATNTTLTGHLENCHRPKAITQLPPSKICYIRSCKNKFKRSQTLSEAEKQYPKMCHPCADFNFMKRHQRADLSCRNAVVTGGRIKIGYNIVLKLLRDGCRVITTTRFPNDASKRFSQEADYKEWTDRLLIYPLDLKDMRGIHRFVTYVESTFKYLDIIINNAAQTIRRPIHFYQHLLEYEQLQPGNLPIKKKKVPTASDRLTYQEPHMTHALPNPAKHKSHTVTLGEDSDDDDFKPPDRKRLRHSHNSTSSPSLPSTSSIADTSSGKADMLLMDENHSLFFPEGLLDQDGQQVDLRRKNSWITTMEDVPVGEMIEVLMINTIAPFMINKDLKPLMKNSPFTRKFIVNVSAMEGQFNRDSKTKFHPHTNMAKAALNMMTRTGALSFKDANIYMSSVDTGWVTDERPVQMAQHESQRKGFMLPLDIIDGAARIYDPIVQGLDLNSEPFYAVFLKDYKPYPW